MIEQIAPRLWAVRSTQRLGPGMHFPTRMTIAQLDDGGLWLHSPIRLDEDMAQQVEALGPIAHVIAPNCYHHLNLLPWLKRFPTARLWAAPGLRAKRPDLPIIADLDDQVPSEWRGQIEQILIAGAPKLNEVVFRHVSSQTLLVTDLVFNIQNVDSFMLRLALRMTGTANGLAQSRIWKALVRDRAAAAGSAARMLQWDFVRMVPAHGEVVSENARAAVTEALARMVPGAR